LYNQLKTSFLHSSYFTVTIVYSYGFIVTPFAVQRYSASDFHIPSNCSNHGCLLLGFNFESRR